MNKKSFQMVSGEELLTIIGISEPTLFKWRGLGLPHFRGPGNARKIRYNVPDVLEWMATNGRPTRDAKKNKA